MSKFEFNIDDMQRMQPTIKKPVDTVSRVENQFDSLRRQMNPEIRGRCNVDEQLRAAGNRLVDVVSKLNGLDRFVMYSIEQYERTEKYLEGKAVQLATSWYNPQIWGENLKTARETVVEIGSALISSKGWLRKKGVQFFLEERKGRLYIKVGKWSWNPRELFYRPLDASEWSEKGLRNQLESALGKPGKHSFTRTDMQTLTKDGLLVYDYKTGQADKKSSRRFLKNEFPQLKNTLHNLYDTSALQRASKAFSGAINPLSDFTGWFGKGVTNLDRVAKLPGIVGIGIDIIDNLDTVRNEHGKVDFKHASFEQKKKFVVDTSVDVMSGSAAMATGAAIGSLILPPLGTVAGAIVGGAVYAGINAKFIGDDPKKSVVDATKDFANDIADGLVSGFRKLDKIFW